MADLNGYGTILTVTDGTASTTVGKITNITGPNGTRDTIDCSAMDTASNIKTFLPGGWDEGDVSATVNYDGTAAGTANGLWVLRTASAMTWAIKLNDHTTASSRSNFALPGFITSLGHAIPNNDKVTQDFTFKISAPATYTDLA